MIGESFERQPSVRFGVYLRPSYAMCRAQAEMHDLLRRQFGLVAGGAFMPHATIKGFFRSDATINSIVGAVDVVVRHRPRFTVVNNGPVPFGRGGVSLDVQHGEHGERNEAMQALHEAIFTGLAPVVHETCDFTPREWALERFFAHLTLAMADIPDFLFDEVHAFIRDAEPIGPRRFTAEYLHLFAFRSDDWSGEWWHSLRWRLLQAWKLSGPDPTPSAILNRGEAVGTASTDSVEEKHGIARP